MSALDKHAGHEEYGCIYNDCSHARAEREERMSVTKGKDTKITVGCPKFKIGTDKEGEVDVELVQGCGENATGISLRINGICVVHITGDLGGYAKMDVYATAARVAGMNWVDVYSGSFGNELCVGNH